MQSLTSYKTRNCSNIRKIFDILNKRYFEEQLACAVINLDLKRFGESRVFLKSKTISDRKRLSKSRYSTKLQPRFVRTEKSFVKIFVIKRKDLPISLLLRESASVLEQAN